MLVGEAYDEQTVSQIGNPELRSVGEGLEMKAPKFSKLALGAVIIFACLAIPAFAQRGGGSHGGGGGGFHGGGGGGFRGGGGSFGGRGGFRSGASVPLRMGGGYSGRMSSAPRAVGGSYARSGGSGNRLS